MRRSLPLLRNAKGRGWYYHFKEAPEDFARHVTPTPFDWKAVNEFSTPSVRPTAYFTFSSGTEQLGTLEFELAKDIAPRTVENFCKLVTGDNAFGRSYKGTKIHRIQKDLAIMAGDVENHDGTGSHSAYEQRFMKDENFIIPHSERGLLSMVSVGVNTNGSQFYVGLGVNPQMNGRCTVFGRLIGGEDVLARIEKVFTVRRTPVSDIVVSDCGVRAPK